MKKFIALLLSLILVFTFAACSKNKGEAPYNPGVTLEPVEVSGIGATAKVTLEDDNRGTGTMANKAQIPTFSVDGDSAAINAINERIKSEVVTLCDAAAAEPLQYAVAITQVVDSGRYLQAIVSYGNALSLDGLSVATYIYDKSTDTEATYDDALAAGDFTDASLKTVIKEIFKDKGPGGDLKDMNVMGFAFTGSGYPQFFVKVTFDTGEDEQVELITVVPETNSLDQANIDGSVLVKE